MLIGELAKKTGLSKDTIRFYAKMGLITASDRKAGTRIYQEFAEETIEQLTIIDRAKKLGFQLKEIQQLLNEWGDVAAIPKEELIRAIKNKLEQVEEKMQQLETIKDYLVAKLNTLKQDV